MCDISLSPLCLLICFICSLYLSLQVKGQHLQFIFMMRVQCSCLSFGEEVPLLDSTPEFCLLSHNSMRKLKLKVIRFDKHPQNGSEIQSQLSSLGLCLHLPRFQHDNSSFVAYSQMLLSTLTNIFSSFQWEGWTVYLAHHIIRNRR